MPTLSKDETQWRVEDDARTMAHYEEIMSDPTRKKAAVEAAKSLASDLNKRANAMNRVAGTKSIKSSTTTKRKK
jgi:hypothetical protein